MSQRLADSKRNELIANFMEGKEDPDYEVIPSKITKGKYTVRKRKVNLPVEEEPQAPLRKKRKKRYLKRKKKNLILDNISILIIHICFKIIR